VTDAPPPSGGAPPGEPARRRIPWMVVLVLALAASLIWMWRSSGGEDARRTVDYSVAYGWIQDGQVKAVTFRDHALDGDLSAAVTVDGKQVETFHSVVPGTDDSLLPLLRAKHVTIKAIAAEQSTMLTLLIGILPWVILIGAWLWMSKRAQRMMTPGGGGAMGGFLRRGKRFEKAPQVAGVTFDDVAGLAGAKRDLREIVQFLEEPERFRKLGGRVPRGVLLIGPPGTGKTLIARAVAGEAGVPFYSISASEFIEMFVGVGAARVRDLFDEAKKHAPSIIFIDEIDAVGRTRGAGLGGGHDEREQTLNQMLSEMDGFERSDQTIVLAATNRPDVLDAALLRPGRFDRRVVVALPELAAREEILRVHTQKKPLATDVDLHALAESTPGFSGADLANLANEAALGAARRGAAALNDADFATAYDKIVLGDPREGKLGAGEQRRVAFHEAGHALVARVTPGAEPVRRVSILPRGMALGVTQQTPAEDRHLLTRAELDARLAVLLGGYAAERVVFGEISTGAEDDLREATRLASKMVAHFGMSDELGPVYYPYEEEHPFLGRRLATESGASDATVHAIERAARKLLGAARDAAERAITGHRATLDALGAALLEHETLEKDALDQIVAAAAEVPAPAPRPVPAARAGGQR
jgi:cell division protease FtsH